MNQYVILALSLTPQRPKDKLNKIRQLVISKDYLEASPQFGVGKNNLRRETTILHQ